MGTVTPIQATDEAIVRFPPTEVWRVLADVATYFSWWPRHLGLRVLHCEAGLVGSELEQRLSAAGPSAAGWTALKNRVGFGRRITVASSRAEVSGAWNRRAQARECVTSLTCVPRAALSRAWAGYFPLGAYTRGPWGTCSSALRERSSRAQQASPPTRPKARLRERSGRRRGMMRAFECRG
jgi:hypothetical protein